MAQHFNCRYCGAQASSVSSLTSMSCSRHPNGPGKGKHVLYEGSEKPKYTCKFCGSQSSSISSLTSMSCARHPNGAGKGKHEPAM